MDQIELRRINDALASMPHDVMNDYTPPAIWLDTDTGTYGDAKRLVIIDVSNWSDDDEQLWHDMTDSERSGYGIDYYEAQQAYGYTPELKLPATPSEYMRGIGR
jgi:hypothetical protein